MNDRTGVAALVGAAVGFWAVGVLVDVTAGLVVLVAGVACGVGLLVRAHDDERRRRLRRRAGTGRRPSQRIVDLRAPLRGTAPPLPYP